jgi:Fe(3+) dicitrate transport protein
MANLHTTCGTQGRLRRYHTAGVEPRMRVHHRALGAASEADFGVRLHVERQHRRQENGDFPTARSGELVEHNLRDNTALATFVQNRFLLGDLTITPGVRLEHVRYRRTNRLAGDATGETAITHLVPGLGISHAAHARLTWFAGVHRGFAPPRTEDIVSNTGGVIDLDPELSWNYEAGVRGHAGPLSVELTAFRMEFENQIIPASVAGGTGAALTNSGRTLHRGAEIGLRLDAGKLLNVPGPYAESSLTWLPTARFEGERYAFVTTAGADAGKVYTDQNGAGTRQQVSVTGSRLPYAPRTTGMIAIGFHRPGGVDLRLERFGTGAQFTDPTNSRVTVADGQQGPIDGYAIWGLSASQPISRTGTRVFLSVRNLTDELYVADRTRGLLPGAPRSVHVGLRQEF